ncbi:MAG: hypothetical protein GYB20_14695 [Oceanospirillales bacterium]|nr:hypothetical protein [Oceanospirillales bacterium]MBR9888930.1 hypothetical protein [Oceanospirillales bacterium]
MNDCRNHALWLLRCLACCLIVLCIPGTQILWAATADNGQPAANVTAATLPDFPPLSDFDVIISRPLFINGREPGIEPSETFGGDAQVLLASWKLTGISITPERSLAIFKELKGSKHLRLEVGMLLDGRWQVDEITPNNVSLFAGDQEVSFVLRQPRERNPATARQTTSQRTTTTSEPAQSNTAQGPATVIPQDRSRQKQTE